MTIDVVHKRDPDYGCEIEVYVDGIKVPFDEWSFDPGAGYEMSEFDEDRDNALEAAPEYLRPVLAQIYDEMEPTYRRWSL